jgi:hypothetical protein
MNVSFAIGALGALLFVSPAVAEDSYYAIPLGGVDPERQEKL